MKLLKISRYTTNKDGTPLINKNGKPYTRVSIQVAEYPGKFASGFGDPITEKWTEGDEVDIVISEVKSGENTYLNFVVKKPLDPVTEARFSAIESRLKALESKPVPHLANGEVSVAKEDYPWDN